MIKIKTANGTGVKVNPYERELMMPFFGGGYQSSPNPNYQLFEATNTPLDCYTADNKPFLDKGEFEGEAVWQYYDVVRDCWDEGITSSAKDYKGCDTRQIYRIYPKAEQTEPPLENHFYLNTKFGPVHVNMNPNADKETFDAVEKMVELAHKKLNKKSFKYSRETPYDVNLEDLLTELLEYMEDREDADHNGDNFVPNNEMKLAIDIRQALYQLERKPSYTEAEVKEIAINCGSPRNFDKWWAVTELNKGNRK